jgi:hypothetical protein
MTFIDLHNVSVKTWVQTDDHGNELHDLNPGVTVVPDPRRPELKVLVWISQNDGALVVQVDTPEGTDDHDTARLYVNDAQVSGEKP